MSMEERPARRTKPVPTSDAGIDPVEFRPGPVTTPQTPSAPASGTTEGKGASTPAAAPAAPTRPTVAPPADTAPIGREVTVQLSTRISPDVDALLSAAAARTGKKKRALIEEAITNLWGS